MQIQYWISRSITDDYGNLITRLTAIGYDQYVISTNTYGGYDFHHSYLVDAVV